MDKSKFSLALVGLSKKFLNLKIARYRHHEVAPRITPHIRIDRSVLGSEVRLKSRASRSKIDTKDLIASHKFGVRVLSLKKREVTHGG